MTTKGGGFNSATSIRDYFSEDNECMNGGMEAWICYITKMVCAYAENQ